MTPLSASFSKAGVCMPGLFQETSLKPRSSASSTRKFGVPVTWWTKARRRRKSMAPENWGRELNQGGILVGQLIESPRRYLTFRARSTLESDCIERVEMIPRYLSGNISAATVPKQDGTECTRPVRWVKTLSLNGRAATWAQHHQ